MPEERESRDGMSRGRCFMLDDRTAGQKWQELKRQPKLMRGIQDDQLTRQSRRSETV